MRAEIYALGRNGNAAKKEMCVKCRQEHYRLDGKCWANTTCALCQRRGHPDTNCFKACPFCLSGPYKPHLKTEPCLKQAQILKLKEHLESLGLDGMSEMVECLKF
ncbi:Aste57867_16688 [Aphanomyces stellatus]|uniref:Aste57867_16688 protein n=1 Tax=Aphanomyces stellatus TaxID=120398 RepID=A0A485L6D5_9STRA|nr:hypothetical protein As57867_016631 [Aphanomyces stellatus]VFT93458.1 Aste57867_16688 [Aphanomyces stellatus]